jgi:ATP-dependent Lon protease
MRTVLDLNPVSPTSARRQLSDLPDDLWTKINIEFYKDGADAVFKALVE